MDGKVLIFLKMSADICRGRAQGLPETPAEGVILYNQVVSCPNPSALLLSRYNYHQCNAALTAGSGGEVYALFG